MTLTKDEAERRVLEESRQKAEARCAVLQDTTNRLEGDLARLTAQVKWAALTANDDKRFVGVCTHTVHKFETAAKLISPTQRPSAEEYICVHLCLHRGNQYCVFSRREEACLRRISHNGARISGKTCSIPQQQALAMSPHYGIECDGERAYWASS